MQTCLKRAIASTRNALLQQTRLLTIAVGVSGGVDSAVAAMLLKQQGHDVFGIFMRNWDESEETGNQNCSVERDYKDAQAVCDQLAIPLHQVDFVSHYWNQVFTSFLSDYNRGLTPNPDLACNRYIKFDALIQHAKALGAETVATGHYARLLPDVDSGGMQLYKGIDNEKDQSYFLASVLPSAFDSIRFPLGDKTKQETRQLAQEYRLPTATKRSSAGICFIGRRDFADFLEEYVPSTAGKFINVDTQEVLGPCSNIKAITIGQRPGIGGFSQRTYVVGKDVVNALVFVGQGGEHPALYTKTACLRTPHWLSKRHEEQLINEGVLRCEYSARYRQPTLPCTIRLVGGDMNSFDSSALCVLEPEDSQIQPGYLIVEFDQPAKAITPQQAFVIYDGSHCIGSAPIAFPGKTMYELNNV